MAPVSGAVERARADLEAGRPWMARDRLTSALAQRQDDEILDLLAEVHAVMGDLPAAGALWFATGRDDETARPALDAWSERNPTDERRWLSIPSPVRRHATTANLTALRDAATAASRARTSPPAPDQPDEAWWERIVFGGGCLVGVLWLVAMVGIGMWTVLRWIWT
jgi:hypothetical protein